MGFGVFLGGFVELVGYLVLSERMSLMLEKRSNLIIIEKYKNHIVSKKFQKFFGLLIRYKYTSSSIDGVINSMPNIRDSR